ncbi:PQQ-binding-like beta-propeller repeat protein [Luteithermobacter gelatinilyticus]|uniref:outer membrane protein assembly factor BamB family protein n=1 Tax=Luteithermobacter gelatinilyticus TaxID=2582913 RepID=UPI001105C89B|nr:PQQ-binding-like beta-propeller repeat protein [Luteithermobacter gelatinilyticus]
MVFQFSPAFNRFRYPLLAVMIGSLAACGGRSSPTSKDRLEGERIPVLTFEQTLQPDSDLHNLQIVLPAPQVNPEWPQAGGNARHYLGHPALSDNPRKIWSTDIGEGSNGRHGLGSMPVISDGRVYMIDSRAVVRAFDAETGRKIWEHKFKEEGETEKNAYGGGVTTGGGRLFITNGYGHVAAMDPATGEVVWQTRTGTPMRGAPTYADGRVFALTNDNQTYAIDAENGEILWNEIGIAEVAGLLGAASPAVIGTTVISAYSSGEIYAMRVENGRGLWSDTLSRQGRLTAMASLRDVDGHPVIYDNKVYAISHSGRMVAIDLRTGTRIWEQNVGSQHMPWVAGDFIYVVTPESELICLTRRDGKIRWITQLERYKDPNSRKEPVHWHGPLLAGDRLVVTSSHGYAVSVSPYTGEFISGLKLPGDAEMGPIVANNTLYIMTTDGELVAYR